LGTAEISNDSAFNIQQVSVMGVQKSKLSKMHNSMAIEDNDGMFSLETVQNYSKACEIPRRTEL
jgi:hypothetical protein